MGCYVKRCKTILYKKKGNKKSPLRDDFPQVCFETNQKYMESSNKNSNKPLNTWWENKDQVINSL